MVGTRVNVNILSGAEEATGTVVDRDSRTNGWLVEMDDPSVVPESWKYYPLVWVTDYCVMKAINAIENESSQEEYIGEW